jgi:hypothetical protein
MCYSNQTKYHYNLHVIKTGSCPTFHSHQPAYLYAGFRSARCNLWCSRNRPAPYCRSPHISYLRIATHPNFPSKPVVRRNLYPPLLIIVKRADCIAEALHEDGGTCIGWIKNLANRCSCMFLSSMRDGLQPQVGMRSCLCSARSVPAVCAEIYISRCDILYFAKNCLIQMMSWPISMARWYSSITYS